MLPLNVIPFEICLFTELFVISKTVRRCASKSQLIKWSLEGRIGFSTPPKNELFINTNFGKIIYFLNFFLLLFILSSILISFLLQYGIMQYCQSVFALKNSVYIPN